MASSRAVGGGFFRSATLQLGPLGYPGTPIAQKPRSLLTRLSLVGTGRSVPFDD